MCGCPRKTFTQITREFVDLAFFLLVDVKNRTTRQSLKAKVLDFASKLRADKSI